MRGEFVDIGGARLYYYAAGTRGPGAPIVLIHGFPMSSRLWSTVVRDFPPGHRLVVVDLPGFGRSDPPHADAVSCAGHADAVRRLLDDLRIERACLVGHGLGGGVAQVLAVTHPDRVSHLALVSSVGFGVAPRRLARLARAVAPIARVLPPGLLAGLVHGSVTRGFADRERSRLTLDACLQPFLSRAGRDLLAAHLRAIGHCDSRTWSARLGDLRIPAAVIWGRHDPFFPVSLGERLAAAIPGASLHILPGAAHFVPEDAPERLLRVVAELVGK